MGASTASALALLAVNKAFALGAKDGMDQAHTGDQSTNSVQDTVTTITQILMYAVGIISVVIIIFSGIMYATAAGDEAKVKKAKNGLVGGLVGLGIAILAWTLVNFVFSALTQ